MRKKIRRTKHLSAMYCIVFDLDRTLISTETTRDLRLDSFPVLNATRWCHVRPQTGALLRTLSAREDIKLCIWTAGVTQYANDVVDGLCETFGLHRETITVFSRNDATQVRLDNTTTYVKDLRIVQQHIPSVTDVVLVDDDPIHQRLPSNRGRVVQVPPFHRDPNDNVLTYVLLQMEIMSRAAEKTMETTIVRPVPLRPQPLFLSSV